jgi:hypothetical protein
MMLEALVKAGLVSQEALTAREFEERLPDIRRRIRLLREGRAAYVQTVSEMATRVDTDPKVLARVRRSIQEKIRKGIF